MVRRLVCILAVLTVAGTAVWKFILSPVRHPNVLVILLDTLRADHLGTYGYARDTSPFLDSFAAQNVKFNFAITAAPWTPPSVASIFTGKYAASHGFFPPNSREEAKKGHLVFSPEHDTLAEIFQRNGYATGAVSPNPWITAEFKFDQGFENFVYVPRAPAEKINSVAEKLLAKFKQEDKPFFLYLHYLDPHDPYAPPAGYANMFNEPLPNRNYSEEMFKTIGLYDGEIRYLDTSLKNLFDSLDHKGLLEDLLVVIVGDHGEQFEEHGFLTHGNTVYNVETHVPLIVKLPRQQRKVVDHTVSTIDIFPTLLTAAGIELPRQESLAVPLLDETAQINRAGVMSRISRKLKQRAYVTYDGIKLIIGGSAEGDMSKDCDPRVNVVGVFNSRKDYTEKNSLTAYLDLPELQAELGDTLKMAKLLKNSKAESPEPLTDEAVNQLRSLGYLN